MKTSNQSGLREKGRIYTEKYSKTKPQRQFWHLFVNWWEKTQLLLHQQHTSEIFNPNYKGIPV